MLNGLSLVDGAAVLDDPAILVLFVWPVVPREQKELFALVCRHDRS